MSGYRQGGVIEGPPPDSRNSAPCTPRPLVVTGGAGRGSLRFCSRAASRRQLRLIGQAPPIHGRRSSSAIRLSTTLINPDYGGGKGAELSAVLVAPMLGTARVNRWPLCNRAPERVISPKGRSGSRNEYEGGPGFKPRTQARRLSGAKSPCYRNCHPEFSRIRRAGWRDRGIT